MNADSKKHVSPSGLVCHCLRCGKDFYEKGDLTCGGRYNGKAMCDTSDVQREVDRRIDKAMKEQGNGN